MSRIGKMPVIVPTGVTVTANGGGAFISSGAWHHLACTYDGTGLQLYIDGAAWGAPAGASGPISSMRTTRFVTIGSEDGRVYEFGPKQVP